MFKKLIFVNIVLFVSFVLSFSALAETVFIPIDFSGIESKSINHLFVETAIMQGQMGMLDGSAQSRLLNERFPANTSNDGKDIEFIFAQGKDSYFNGEFDSAIQQISSALDSVEKNMVLLALRPSFSDVVFEGAAYLMQIYLYGINDTEGLNAAIDRCVRLFPTREPEGDYFPQELADLYRQRMPNERMGHVLKVETSSDCETRVNGQVIPANMAAEGIKVFSAKYAVSKYCGNLMVRTFVVPVFQSETVNFEDEFSRVYTYPKESSLKATSSTMTMDQLVSYLLTIGRRLEVDHIVGVGTVSEGHPFMDEGYNAILIDVNAASALRARLAKTVEVSQVEGMKDFVRSLWTGEGYSRLSNTGKNRPMLTAGIVLASVGGAALVSATTLAIMAKLEDDKFNRLLKDAAERDYPAPELAKAAHNRDSYKLPADILFGVGGGLAAAGIALIVVDILKHKKLSNENLYYSNSFKVDLNISPENMGLSLLYRW